jgi:hypothetical protein
MVIFLYKNYGDSAIFIEINCGDSANSYICTNKNNKYGTSFSTKNLSATT